MSVAVSDHHRAVVRRWAVLWDVVQARPVGLAYEHRRHVHVISPSSYGAPTVFEGEYHVLQPDGTVLVYGPGSEGYFEQVMLELSRVFGIGKRGVCECEIEEALTFPAAVSVADIPQEDTTT